MAMQNKLREKMAGSFLAALNEGKIPWKACWQSCQPENAVTGKMYRGINSAMLSYYAEERGFTDPRWCTYVQAQKKGWQVRKGSEGCPVEYWAYFDSFQKKLLSWTEAAQLLKDPEYADKYLQLRSRVSIVFNAAQIAGIPERAAMPQTDIDAIRGQRDTLLRNMALSYREEGGQAYYSPTKDRVTLPPEKSFFDAYSYAGTFLHECGHATGHPSRLNRDMSGGFGSESYAREELRAEIASAFTAQAIGLHLTDEQLQPHMELHKAYIQSWASALQDAPGELFRAIKDAEKISDYLIEKGEFEMILEAEQEKKTEAPEKPVGRIEYLGANGRVGEAVEYTDSNQFAKDIIVESHYGSPMTVVLYQDSDGDTFIPKESLYKLDPPPRVKFEDIPQRKAKEERPKESFDKLFAGIEKERISKQATAPTQTIMLQREH